MKLTIIPIDKVVMIDSVPKIVDLDGLIASNIHAVQWDGVKGHIEYVGHNPANKPIESLDSQQLVAEGGSIVIALQGIIDAYNAAPAIGQAGA